MPSEDIKPLQADSATVAHLVVGKLLKDGRTDGLTGNKENSERFRVGTQTPLMSMEDGLELEP